MSEKKETREHYSLYPKPDDKPVMERIRASTKLSEAGVLRWGLNLVHEKLFGKE